MKEQNNNDRIEKRKNSNLPLQSGLHCPKFGLIKYATSNHMNNSIEVKIIQKAIGMCHENNKISRKILLFSLHKNIIAKLM